MPWKVISVVVHPGGKLRAIVFERDDGSFGFEDQWFSDDPMALCWIPRGRHSVSFCDTAERAASEAQGRIDWLADLPAPPAWTIPTEEID